MERENMAKGANKPGKNKNAKKPKKAKLV